jgi:hypothetical protein
MYQAKLVTHITRYKVPHIRFALDHQLDWHTPTPDLPR